MRSLRLLFWMLANRCYWFQRKKPVREFRTRIVEGRPGEGKSVYMAQEVIRMMRKGYLVYSNVSFRDPVFGTEAVKLRDWEHMMQVALEALKNGQPTIFAIDEIQQWADARGFSNTPAWWKWLISQRRHFGIAIIGTTQNLAGVEVYLRRLVDGLVRIRNRTFLRIPFYVIEEVDPTSVDSDDGYTLTGDRRMIWMRWYGFKGYDTQELVSVKEFDPKDEALAVRMALLQEEAESLVAPGVIKAFMDSFDDVDTVVE